MLHDPKTVSGSDFDQETAEKIAPQFIARLELANCRSLSFLGNLLSTTLQAEHWGQKDAKVPQWIKHLGSALKGAEQHLQCTAGTFRGKRKK